jgi:molecular chaperone HscB
MTSFDLDFARKDHFALFGLPRTFALDAEALERVYREIQAQVHPDKHAHLPDADKRLAMQWATQVNAAYQTLKNPLARGRYLLQLAGHDPRIETNTAMPPAFLMQQMEWRETVADARAAGDDARLDELHRGLKKDMKLQYERLATALDGGDMATGAELVRQLMFQEKLLSDIDDALAALDA